MVKRFLSANASDILSMNAQELKQSIKASEGRIICSEVIGNMQPIIGDITNAEVAVSYGADLILMNGFDCYHPHINGLTDVPAEELVTTVRDYTGRPIGINLEPVDNTADLLEQRIEIPKGRACSAETLSLAENLGLDFICLTGNPGTGVTNKSIVEAIKLAKIHFSGLVIAGKMHGAGVSEPVVSLEVIKQFVEAGADVILMPAVGSIPGFTDEELISGVRYAKEHGALTMSAIGTSQESADQETVKQIALRNKIAGVDIQHIGDGGYAAGVATLENIYAMSVAIRGLRHTMSRVSRSAKR
ncbi:haloacid dehalogenase-like hydrolase [Vagococcus sp. DIV0080]|uniref:Haloacid dehalogenase-like hydrolase n=1 Tax=Candidatus Vagococcus giribetii TaxID=2230876 RepID=A0ABS3HQI4_9ENTE|nr:haloacid dehalogenase-like hydrolase [Vagococcus sp. DIV0080]MBO0476004.1 haloacid dehalogenase-like hydrolase [Vagococcus sp. DIV0080]